MSTTGTTHQEPLGQWFSSSMASYFLPKLMNAIAHPLIVDFCKLFFQRFIWSWIYFGWGLECTSYIHQKLRLGNYSFVLRLFSQCPLYDNESHANKHVHVLNEKHFITICIDRHANRHHNFFVAGRFQRYSFSTNIINYRVWNHVVPRQSLVYCNCARWLIIIHFWKSSYVWNIQN